MTRKYRLQFGGGLLLAGVLAGLLFVWSQNPLPMMAKEVQPPKTPPATLNPEVEDTTPQIGLAEVNMLVDGRQYRLEVTETWAQKQKGLMYRKSLPRNKGMLFSFEPPQEINFWMKNTKIPLDMIFIRSGEVRHVVHDAKPCKEDPCPRYASVYPVDTVVELAAGTAKKNGIASGDKVTFFYDKPKGSR